jgi:RNA polymerase sigma-70 factor (ECF subfamily)
VTKEPTPLEVEIIARLRLGEADALAVVYDRYAATVYRIAYGLLRDAAEAEDLVHDVFVGLSRAVRTFEGRGSFEAWLKRVTARAALMRLRRQRLRRGYVRQQRQLLSPFRSDASVAARLDLERALGALAPSLRAVFVLKEVHGYSHAEIAELLGITVSAARARLCRARRGLRSNLTRD